MSPEITKVLIEKVAALGAVIPQDRLDVMAAYVDGATIETRYIEDASSDAAWHITSSPSWEFQSMQYRVKPVAVRPYTVCELAEAIGHHSGSKIVHKATGQTDKINRIDFDDSALPLSIGHEWLTLEDLANKYTWLDDTPCGVKL